jgi:transmembrane sensor
MNPPTHPARGHVPAVLPSRIEELAADWLARRESGLSIDEQAEFSRWLMADPRHARSVERIEASWRRLQQPRFSGQAQEVIRAVQLRVERRQKRRRRMLLGSLGTVLAAAAAVAVALLPARLDPARPEPLAPSVALRPERQILADGSVVELNAGAEVNVDFSTDRRAVRLLRGQAHFTVAKDTRRPFLVQAGTVAVRAVGTIFTVELAPQTVEVLVTEGRVAVEQSTAAATPSPAANPSPTDTSSASAVTYVDAGTQLSVPTAARPAAPLRGRLVTAAQSQAMLAWRGMRVEFSGTPLAEIVALFNRRNRVQLELGAAELGTIHISGIFWADDPEGFSRLLEASAGVRADRARSDRIVLQR